LPVLSFLFFPPPQIYSLLPPPSLSPSILLLSLAPPLPSPLLDLFGNHPSF
jgi:hypothetical protein